MYGLSGEERPLVAITIGDVAGVGPEIAIRALADIATYRICRPLIVGDLGVIQTALDGMGLKLEVRVLQEPAQGRYLPGHVDMLDLANIDLSRLERGKASAMAGAAAYDYIIKATELALEGQVDALVTCPINKDALNQAGYRYPGHTEIFAERTGTRDYTMMLIAGSLRVVLVTIHVPLHAALNLINEERILRAIRLAHEAGALLGIQAPRIAVPGLNPHAGEGGIFGRQEIDIIAPAIKKAREAGYDARGPFPAETLFYRAIQGEFDFVTPMYHDQGLIPIKLLGHGGGVNVTLGLPIIRTSVDHGTAFGKAWQFRASAGSLLDAIRLAAQLASARRRIASKECQKNSLD